MYEENISDYIYIYRKTYGDLNKLILDSHEQNISKGSVSLWIFNRNMYLET